MDSIRLSIAILLVLYAIQVAPTRLVSEERTDAFSPVDPSFPAKQELADAYVIPLDLTSRGSQIGVDNIDAETSHAQGVPVNEIYEGSDEDNHRNGISEIVELIEAVESFRNIVPLEISENRNSIYPDATHARLSEIQSLLEIVEVFRLTKEHSETESLSIKENGGHSKKASVVVLGLATDRASEISSELAFPKIEKSMPEPHDQISAKEEFKGSSDYFSDLTLSQRYQHQILPSNILTSGESDTVHAGIMITLTEQGLSYLRDVLVNQVLQEVTPLKLPNMRKSMHSPLGILEVTLTDIVLSGARVASSEITLGKEGMSIYASGVQADISLNWNYTYVVSYGPFSISDGGGGYLKVKDGQAGVVFSMDEHNGTLNLTVLQSGTYLTNLEINLNGGASWIYNWLAYAFGDQIRAAIETALTDQIVQGVGKLDSFLQHIPRKIPIDDTAAVDVTVVQNPVLNSAFLSVGVKGEFLNVDSVEDSSKSVGILPVGLFCSNSLKMVTMALSDHVLDSAAAVYFDAGRLQWLVDKLPEQSLLNTGSWKYLIPKLYRSYPNQNMVLNFSVSAVPLISLKQDGIHATTSTDMTILVMNNVQGTPVACISLTISMDAVAGLNGNNITAEAALTSLSLELKWSEIGSFPVRLVEQVAIRTIVKDVVLPLLNFNLRKGFPLPVLPSVQLQHADVRYKDGFLLVCTDVRYEGGPF
ncbi:hypothetical protein O6H91_01G136800 [Diphasiastrum complanatum]|uniref:Uncharacterized protein n=1 Tax=Diphasiastrum complanatum TaxID=34168 RepID=A0ACC2EWK1_DIPCM|nr:hypothetical protein O6H91_01G136800 [Diphasiastrum complanatum]